VGTIYGRVQPSDSDEGCGHAVFWDRIGMTTSAQRSGIERDGEAERRRRERGEVRRSIEAMKKISPPIPPGYRPPKPEREQEEEMRQVRKKNAPLRKVLRLIEPRRGSFRASLVLLECNHRVRTWGDPSRTRCLYCVPGSGLDIPIPVLIKPPGPCVPPKERRRLDQLSAEEGHRLDLHAQVLCPCGSEIPFGKCHDLIRKTMASIPKTDP